MITNHGNVLKIKIQVKFINILTYLAYKPIFNDFIDFMFINYYEYAIKYRFIKNRMSKKNSN